MHTEEQAREKWCPMARGSIVVGDDIISGLNRDGYGKPWKECLCIASDCMAWRWGALMHDVIGERWIDRSCATESAAKEELHRSKMSGMIGGRCGLTGQP